MSSLVDFLKRTIDYVFTIKKYTWCYQTKVKDHNGNIIVLTHRKMSKDPPFTGNDDIAIKTFPPVGKLVLHLQKKLHSLQKKKDISDEQYILKKNLKKILVKATQLDPKQAYEEAVKFGVQPDPHVTRFSTILSKLQLGTQLTRYTEITFQPTSALIQNPTSGFDANTQNTFNGFTLNKYSPSKLVDVTTTKLWEYFREVFGYGKTTHVQFRYILNLLAFQLQFPETRTGRIILIISKAEGTGKSFLVNILTMLFKGYTN